MLRAAGLILHSQFAADEVLVGLPAIAPCRGIEMNRRETQTREVNSDSIFFFSLDEMKIVWE